jgi:hypothetical protein
LGLLEATVKAGSTGRVGQVPRLLGLLEAKDEALG